MKSKDRAFTQRLKDKLLTEMARLGLNGQRLAQRSKVSDSEISRILSGQSTPGLENAFRLARAVGVSLDYLADDALEADPLRATDPLSPDERRLLDLAQRVGQARAILLLENISFIGYDMAMQRLLGAKPVIEIDLGDETRPVAQTAPVGVATAPRSNSA
jgi:transcriptional regulator with XRE-family HTH domain